MENLMKIRTLIALMLMFSLITSCVNKNHFKNDGEIYLYPEYAKGFYVTKSSSGDYTLIIRNPSDTTQVISRVELKKDDIKDSNTACCFSITHIAFYDRIGCIGNMIGIPDSNMFRGSDILNKIDRKNVKIITLGAGTKTEVILDLNPDFLFTSEYQHADFSTITSAGIKVIPVLEYLENTPLGRMEWLRFFGFLMDREEMALSISDSIINKYNSLICRDMDDADRPQILDASEYNGYWYAAGGQSYVTAFFRDAGFDYVWKDDIHNGSFAVSPEEALKQGMTVEYWRFVTDCDADMAITLDYVRSSNQYYDKFRSVREGKVIACNPTGSGYYTTGILEPDVVLQDFILARDGVDGGIYYKLITK